MCDVKIGDRIVVVGTSCPAARFWHGQLGTVKNRLSNGMIEVHFDRDPQGSLTEMWPRECRRLG